MGIAQWKFLKLESKESILVGKKWYEFGFPFCPINCNLLVVGDVFIFSLRSFSRQTFRTIAFDLCNCLVLVVFLGTSVGSSGLFSLCTIKMYIKCPDDYQHCYS